MDESKQLRTISKQKTEEAYTQYLINVQKYLKSDPKFFWNFIHQKNKISRIPGIILSGNDKHQAIVDAFVSFFSSIFSPLEINVKKKDFSYNLSISIEISSEAIRDRGILDAGMILKNTFPQDQIKYFSR